MQDNSLELISKYEVSYENRYEVIKDYMDFKLRNVNNENEDKLLRDVVSQVMRLSIGNNKGRDLTYSNIYKTIQYNLINKDEELFILFSLKNNDIVLLNTEMGYFDTYSLMDLLLGEQLLELTDEDDKLIYNNLIMNLSILTEVYNEKINR